MKIYLINLERSIDRRSHMLSELAKFLPEIPIERALCRDIKNTDWSMPEGIQPGYWKSDRWALGPSDIEIFRSHIDCWKKISESGQIGIVLEDDLIFSENFQDFIEILKVESLDGIIRLDGVNLPLLINKIIKTNNKFNISKVNSIVASAAAYALDPVTAEKLIVNVKVERTVDDYLFDPTPKDRGAKGHGLPIYQLEPIIAVQAQFGTYSDASRKIPVFLEVTKRVDVKYRKSRSQQGPILYRFKKEIMRIIYKYRLKKRKKNILANMGEWRKPILSKDLKWK